MINELLCYEEEAQILEKLILDNDQAIELAVCGCIFINRQTWFKKKRYDNRLQAEAELQDKEVIAETNTAVFILSLNQKEGELIRCYNSLIG